MFANLDFILYLCNALARLTPTGSHILSNTCWITYGAVVGPLSDLYRIPVHLIYTMYISRDFEQICFSPAPEHAKLNDS